MSKKSFILYTSTYDSIKELSLEEKGMLLDAIFNYAIDRTIIDCPVVVKMAFNFIKTSLDMNEQKYTEICQRNKENIKKRWQNKETYDPIRPNTSESTPIQSYTNDTDNESETGSDFDNETENENNFKKKNIPSDISKDNKKGILFEKSKFYMGDFPDDIPEQFLTHALNKGFTTPQAITEFQKFTSHWLGKTSKDAKKTERGWLMAFCVLWLLNAKKFGVRAMQGQYISKEEKTQWLEKGRKDDTAI